jgi:hypothetical protein
MSNLKEQLLGVFPEMDQEDADQFTNSGKPEIKWLKDKFELDSLSAAERDEAWAEYQASLVDPPEDEVPEEPIKAVRSTRKGIMNIRGFIVKPGKQATELDEATLSNPDRMKRIRRAIETKQLIEV